MRMATDFYDEIARIIQSYGRNGNKVMARRRLQLIRVNFGRCTQQQERMIKELKRRL
jgi:hypothetical protein